MSYREGGTVVSNVIAMAKAGCPTCGSPWKRFVGRRGVRFDCGCTLVLRGDRLLKSTKCPKEA